MLKFVENYCMQTNFLINFRQLCVKTRNNETLRQVNFLFSSEHI